MTTTQLHHNTAGQNPVIIRALSSITSQQVEIITQAAQVSDRGWYAYTHGDYDGYLSIVIEPGIRDARLPAYFISGTVELLELLELLEVDNDNMLSIGYFDDATALSARLMDLIAHR